jgi:hypothetical protein
LAEALGYKFGSRDSNPVLSGAAGASKFSLLASGVLDNPSSKLLLINGMEHSIFPIENNLIVVLRATRNLVARGDRRHMGNPGAEDILYKWLDDAIACRP